MGVVVVLQKGIVVILQKYRKIGHHVGSYQYLTFQEPCGLYVANSAEAYCSWLSIPRLFAVPCRKKLHYFVVA